MTSGASSPYPARSTASPSALRHREPAVAPLFAVIAARRAYPEASFVAASSTQPFAGSSPGPGSSVPAPLARARLACHPACPAC
ncbi:hypothetical protein NL676_019482 [Syzygium grande]|nr:hypothetical protein NL676_019482 [Syzygium grande]